MTNTNAEMPRDIHDNPIPALSPLENTSQAITAAAQGAAIPLNSAAAVIYIEADAFVRFAFGGASVIATANSFRASSTYPRVVSIPATATHVRFYGQEAVNIYVEQQG